MTVIKEVQPTWHRKFRERCPREQAKVLYTVQEPTAASLFGRRITVADWRHSKPSWYAVSKFVQTI